MFNYLQITVNLGRGHPVVFKSTLIKQTIHLLQMLLQIAHLKFSNNYKDY